MGKLENVINELTINDTTEISKEEEADTESQADDDGDTDAHSIENHRSISAIMQELQKELERPVMEVTKCFSLRSTNMTDSINSLLATELEAMARFGESGRRRACNSEAR